MYGIENRIGIQLRTKIIVGSLVGIDTYTLESFAGRRCQWPSYTLTSNQKGLFSRYWFVCWGRSEWILWTKAKKSAVPPNAKLVLEKSGIAKIQFKGDAGVSTPVAALIQYKNGNDYFCIERFSNSKALVFLGRKIAKPIVLSS